MGRRSISDWNFTRQSKKFRRYFHPAVDVLVAPHAACFLRTFSGCSRRNDFEFCPGCVFLARARLEPGIIAAARSFFQGWSAPWQMGIACASSRAISGAHERREGENFEQPRRNDPSRCAGAEGPAPLRNRGTLHFHADGRWKRKSFLLDAKNSKFREPASDERSASADDRGV